MILPTLMSKAREVLAKNDNGSFTQPAPPVGHLYNWETSLSALGLRHTDWRRAERDLRRLFRAQWSNGFLPHLVFEHEADEEAPFGPTFWRSDLAAPAPKGLATSGIVHPPVHGFVLWELWQSAPGLEAGFNLLRDFYPRVLALHRYLYAYRDPREEGIVCLHHPWETVTPNSPRWERPLASLPVTDHEDAPSRLAATLRDHRYEAEVLLHASPFQVQDPLFNGLLVWSNEALIRIGTLLGEDVLEIIQWNELTVHSMNERLWDEDAGHFQAFDLQREEVLGVPTSGSFAPLAGMVPTQDQAERLLLHLEKGAFSPADLLLCPSLSPESADFDPSRAHRGAIDISLNWLIYRGLLRYDMDDMAAKLRDHSLALFQSAGFFRYYDPRLSHGTVGVEGPQSSLSAALCLDFLTPWSREEE